MVRDGYGKWPTASPNAGQSAKKKHSPETTPDSTMGQVLDAKHNTAHGFVFDVVHAFGRTRLERRISARMHKVRWALEHREVYLTPAQLQALAMVYGAQLPVAECARRLNIDRHSFQQRLDKADRRVDRLWDGKERMRPVKGRPDAVLRAPEGAAWMEERAWETLGRGAVYVWGADWKQSPTRKDEVDVGEMLREEHEKDR
jgi:predicted DNA-binding protein (UPF0251 family)